MKQKNIAIILVLFLLGIFMGAIDSGIVSPARVLIQNSFGVSRGIGTWMITLYTLVYAVSMPIVSKLSDKYGYKRIYIIGISLFGIGSLLVGLTNFFGTFTFFLGARAIQAIGAGGIMPIANNVIGQSFPKEKRGMALGLVGAIYGVATIIGPTLGSFILNISGTSHWGWIFFINVPISIAIIILSFKLTNIKNDLKKPLDLLGSLIIAVVVGSLMYALTNLDFFDFVNSMQSTKVYPFLLIFIISLPILVLVENKVQDPVLNMKYFRNRQMVIALVLAFLVGVGMMGMVFIPQFAENVLKLKPGSGGYVVTILAVFSGIAAPLSGFLIDKKNARFVLFIGFSCTIIGTLVMALLVTHFLSFASLLLGLAFMGFGVGFTMGAPLNYIVLQSVEPREGTTALATMSVIRSIGITISPSIMIGFIVNAAKKMPTKLMNVLQPIIPSGMDMSHSSGTNAFSNLQNSNVTTIVHDLETAMVSVLPSNIKDTVGPIVVKSINGLQNQIVSTFQKTLNDGYMHMFFAAAAFAFIGFVVSFFLKKGNHELKTNE